MSYEKRVCVLKQIKKGFSADGAALTGAVYAERLGTTVTISAKIPAAPLKGGRYCLAVWIDGQVFYFDYAASVTLESAPSLARGFSALLLFVKSEAEPVAYGGCGEAPRSFESLLAAANGAAQAKEQVAEKKRSRAEETSGEPVKGEPVKDESATARFQEKYNDEAIAESDYFALSQSDEDDGASTQSEAKTQDEGSEARRDESDAHLPPRGSLTYYNEVKEKLGEVFAKYPADERLKAIFPLSEWVNSEGALLGVIYENGIPRYLCVAVEAMQEPPEEIKERGVFVPRTQFSDEEGFYVVFQDADTGEYVRVYDA